jgi:hypothetical protein
MISSVPFPVTPNQRQNISTIVIVPARWHKGCVRTVVDVDVYDRNARGAIFSVLPLRHGAAVRIPTAGYDRIGLQRVIPPRRATVVMPRVCL